MSQHALARPQSRPSSRRSTAQPRRLRVVAPPPAEGNTAFLVLCAVLVLGGMVGVLLLNTAMAKGSYTVRDLQQRSDALADAQDDLRHALDSVSGPGPLAREARAMGMVPAQNAAFLRLSDGTVLGVASKATDDTAFSVVTEASSIATTPIRPTMPTRLTAPSTRR